ncbi:MAG: hypothetical protein U0637_02125 [Phycisphaerales bacterium]
MKMLIALAAAAGLSCAAQAQVRINELMVNAPGTDDGFEFFEFSGPANAPLTNVWLIGLEGDGTGAGSVDVAIDYTGFSLGSNGLLVHRDAAGVLTPAPDAATTLRVSDFSPDLENGTCTWVLVTGFTGALNADLDTNNDGTLDLTPWTGVLSSIALIENDGAANIGYAASLGGVNFGPQAGFNADAFVYGADGQYYGMDVLGTNPGPYAFDTTRMADQSGTLVSIAGSLTPGSANTVPTPGAVALAGIGALTALRRRRAR